MRKPMPEWVGEVKKKMALIGITQKELADAVGLSYGYIRMILSGRMEHDPARKAICEYLNIKDTQ